MQSLLFSFKGRINRARFWLANIAVGIVYAIVVGVLFGGAAMSSDPTAALESVGLIGSIVLLVIMILVAWIGLALSAKRWHDRNKTAWWILIVVIPVIGSLWYLIECGFLKGTSGSNRYGSDPLAPA
jgi:uncharacterized membrane protein YhaH (DUF805 family)